jgi:hypothetical protein
MGVFNAVSSGLRFAGVLVRDRHFRRAEYECDFSRFLELESLPARRDFGCRRLRFGDAQRLDGRVVLEKVLSRSDRKPATLIGK